MDHSANILIIETSGRVGSAALARGGELTRSAKFQADHNHAVELLPTIDRLCRRSGWCAGDLRQVYVSIGPGSFTGLRIAVTVARTLAWSVRADVIAVPTLEVIAQNALLTADPPRHVAVIVDAKRGQVYGAQFELQAGRYVPTAAPRVSDPRALVSALPSPRCVLGEGLAYHAEKLAEVDHQRLPEELWTPCVETVHRLGFERSMRGQFEEPGGLTPLYLRRPEAEEVWERRGGAS